MTWTAPKITRDEPPLVADERSMLDGWLDFHRQTLLWKCAGLTGGAARPARAARPGNGPVTAPRRYRDRVPPARRTSYRGLDLEAARTRTVPDVLPAPGQPFRVLFCGINPGLYSAATGHHFARPGNRFWPALYAAGFTPRLLAPGEQQLLAEYGLGITNLVARATAQASELTREELQAGGARLADLVARHQPRIVAVAGVTAYRAAFGKKDAQVGPQAETIGATRLWVVPNPSGLNAHWPLAAITAEFRRLRAAADAP